MTAVAASIDVRTIPPRARHALIFSTFDALAAGTALELVNDHDPAPLREQLKLRAPGEFEWKYLQAGPEAWRVAITRTAGGVEGGGCCGGGSCSGA